MAKAPAQVKHRLPQVGDLHIRSGFDAQYVVRITEVYPATGAWVGIEQVRRESQHDTFRDSGRERSGNFSELIERVR